MFAQSILELANMPEAVSNNAVCLAVVDGKQYVYSFSGIDESKSFEGIHKKCFKYSVEEDLWEQIADLPSGNGRIAAGASTVKNKIYIFGGYEVFADGSERSFDEVHIYDPESNVFLKNGTPIPVATDDHVQAVYKDSLIFLITGWSDDDNIPNVQIYDPGLDLWQVGTSVPDNNSYKAFGASGTILGDTIYYNGGVRVVAGSFAMSNTSRKGYINPANPSDITWESKGSGLSIGYRMGAGQYFDTKLIWIGGANQAYNYDGLAYTNQSGVDPMSRILFYDPSIGSFSTNVIDFDVMDLRGLAQLSEREIILCGGMLKDQIVSNKTIKLSFPLVSNQEMFKANLNAFPNPCDQELYLPIDEQGTLSLWNLDGKRVLTKEVDSSMSLNVESIRNGIYLLKFMNKSSITTVQKIIIQH